MGQERQKIGRECVDERLFFDLETSEFKVLFGRVRKYSHRKIYHREYAVNTIDPYDHTHHTVPLSHQTVGSYYYQ